MAVNGCKCEKHSTDEHKCNCNQSGCTCGKQVAMEHKCNCASEMDTLDFLKFVYQGAVSLCAENADLVADIINDD